MYLAKGCTQEALHVWNPPSKQHCAKRGHSVHLSHHTIIEVTRKQNKSVPVLSSIIRQIGLEHKTKEFQPNSNGLQPNKNGLQSRSDGLQPDSNGLRPNSDGLQANSDDLQPNSDGLQLGFAK